MVKEKAKGGMTMFRFMKDCVLTWVKCLIGEILVTVLLCVLALGVVGAITIISAAIKYLGS